VIIDKPNFVLYKRNLIDTDFSDYCHIMHLYFVQQNMHYTKPSEGDHTCPAYLIDNSI